MTRRDSELAPDDAYPTRLGGAPEMVPRADPVAWAPWHAGSELTFAQYAAYKENGFVVLPSVFDELEVACMRDEVERLRKDRSLLALPEAIAERSSDVIRSLFAPHRHSRMMAALMRDPRIVAPARLLLGGPIYLHQARVNYKPGFRGSSFYWHSDFETWHAEDGLPRMRTISASITLTENTVLNGPLLLMRGSHEFFVSCPAETPKDHYRDSLQEQVVGTPDDASLERLAQRGIEPVVGPPGTVVLFDANTVHGSAGNITPDPRSNVFFVYNSIENRPVAPFCGRPPRPAFVAERARLDPIVPEPVDLRALAESID
jgi:ectoine hydroxylase